MPRFDPADAALVFAIFTAGGVVKGIAGFGLPTVSLGLLALTRPMPEAMALVLLPTLATNVWQALASGALGPVMRRLAGFMAAACIGTLVAAGQLSKADAALLAGLLGLLMAASAVTALLGPKWPQPSPATERWLSPLIGLVSGGVAGLTGSFMMPAAPWLAALGLPRNAFVQAFALGAVVSIVTLAVAMGAQGLIPPGLGIASVLVLAPAFLGMAIGNRLRGALSEQGFRTTIQACLLVLGCYLALKNLVF